MSKDLEDRKIEYYVNRTNGVWEMMKRYFDWDFLPDLRRDESIKASFTFNELEELLEEAYNEGAKSIANPLLKLMGEKEIK